MNESPFDFQRIKVSACASVSITTFVLLMLIYVGMVPASDGAVLAILGVSLVSGGIAAHHAYTIISNHWGKNE